MRPSPGQSKRQRIWNSRARCSSIPGVSDELRMRAKRDASGSAAGGTRPAVGPGVRTYSERLPDAAGGGGLSGPKRCWVESGQPSGQRDLGLARRSTEFGDGQENVMKAIVQDKYGSPDVLEIRDLDKPVVKDDDVLVRVRAAVSETGTF